MPLPSVLGTFGVISEIGGKITKHKSQYKSIQKRSQQMKLTNDQQKEQDKYDKSKDENIETLLE